jgi:exopolyphosphatase / guanosine-5'-triphosphate,3'-diphosphate pyrophosphatase
VSEPVERMAGIDVGSNTILLLIAEHRPAQGLTILAEDEDQPRLAAGLSATGRLGPAAMERALQTLTRMRDLCRSFGVQRVGAVATAAVREAENGEEFAERVRALDIPLQVISPESEAALSYRSAAYHFPGGARTLVADIGGGSLELIGASRDTITLTRSLPLGAVRLTELALPLPDLRDHIRRALEQTLPREKWAGSAVIGSGGTFANAAAMALAQRGASGQAIHGVEMSAKEIEGQLARLSALSPDARRQVPGLRPERADIIVAGMAVAAELLDRVNAGSVKVNGYGLREGLLLEMAGIDHSP